MKKNVPEFVSAIFTLAGFSYGLIAVIRDQAIGTGAKFFAILISILGILASIFVEIYIIKENIELKRTEDPEHEMRRNAERERAYEEWQKILSDAGCDAEDQ